MAQQPVDLRGKYSNGAFPAIQQAYQNDPRTKLAATMLAQGMNTNPTAGGGWAWADGLARIAQAVGGGLINKAQDKKYAAYEQGLKDEMKANAPGVAYTPPNPAAANPAMANPGVGSQEAVAAALSPQAAMQSDLAPMPQQQPGQPGVMPSPIESISLPPSNATGPQYTPSRAPMNAPASPMSATARTPVGNGSIEGTPDLSDAFVRGIVSQEGVKNKDGTWQTSFKGAIGPAQVMPGTGPEAAEAAGLPWDEKLFYDKGQAGAEYNLKLGEAYFQKQYNLFKDPLKAAAAYNAGPGAVRAAQNKAKRRGGSWIDYLPKTYKDGKVVDSTEEYVKRFAMKVGITPEQAGLPANAWSVSSSTTNINNEDVQGVGPQQVAAPQLEEVPDMPQAPQERPGAPALPDRVQSSYMTMAQKLLQSDNPFAVALGQSYLEKGMEEQFSAATLSSEQQFSRDNMGYQTDLNDYSSAREAVRNASITERQNTIASNRSREDWARGAQFESNENALTREQQARIASQDRQIQRDAWEHERKMKEIGGRNGFLETQGGAKIRRDMDKEIAEYDQGIMEYERALAILDRGLETGAMYAGMGAEEIQARMGGANEDVGDFIAIANNTTLQKLGGSLGVAISDGDRQFVAQSNIGMGKDGQANRNIARFMIGALQRKKDFNYAKLDAELQGGEAVQQFYKDWRAFAESNAIVRYDEDGRPQIRKNPLTFAQWKENRPTYDRNGKRIN